MVGNYELRGDTSIKRARVEHARIPVMQAKPTPLGSTKMLDGTTRPALNRVCALVGSLYSGSSLWILGNGYLGEKRMRKWISTAILLAAGVTINLAPARPKTPDAGPFAISIETLSDGYVRLSVVNKSRQSVTALAAVGSRTVIESQATDRSVRFFDSALNPSKPMDLQSDGSYSFLFFGPNPAPESLKRDVQLKAALFADGSSWGDPDWVKVLTLRRSSAYLYQNKALRALDEGYSDGLTREAFAEKLMRLRNDEYASAKTAAEKQMADLTFAEVLSRIGEASRNGHPVPISESVVQVRNRLLLRIDRLARSVPTITGSHSE